MSESFRAVVVLAPATTTPLVLKAAKMFPLGKAAPAESGMMEKATIKLPLFMPSITKRDVSVRLTRNARSVVNFWTKLCRSYDFGGMALRSMLSVSEACMTR